MEIGSGVEAKQHLKGRGCFLPHLLQTLPSSLYRLTNQFCYKSWRLVSCYTFKVWIWQWCIYKLHKKSFTFLFIVFSYLKISKSVMVLTFLGYSSSPNPYRGSTENAVIIQEVIVSGTVFLSATLPSTLYFVQMQIMLYPSK